MSLITFGLGGSASDLLRLGLESGDAPAGVLTPYDIAQVANAVMDEVIETGFTLRQTLRLLLAVAVGKTEIDNLGGGLATVTFRDINDIKDRVVADMDGSERISVTKDAT